MDKEILKNPLNKERLKSLSIADLLALGSNLLQVMEAMPGERGRVLYDAVIEEFTQKLFSLHEAATETFFLVDFLKANGWQLQKVFVDSSIWGKTVVSNNLFVEIEIFDGVLNARVKSLDLTLFNNCAAPKTEQEAKTLFSLFKIL